MHCVLTCLGRSAARVSALLSTLAGCNRERQISIHVVPWYLGKLYSLSFTMPKSVDPAQITVERVQTGVRLEKRLVKVLKALAEHKDITLGDLLEGIVLHAFDGQPAFTKETLELITQLKQIYGFDLNADASHSMLDRKGA